MLKLFGRSPYGGKENLGLLGSMWHSQKQFSFHFTIYIYSFNSQNYIMVGSSPNNWPYPSLFFFFLTITPHYQSKLNYYSYIILQFYFVCSIIYPSRWNILNMIFFMLWITNYEIFLNPKFKFVFLYSPYYIRVLERCTI